MVPESTSSVDRQCQQINFRPTCCLDSDTTPAPRVGDRLKHSHAALMADMEALYSEVMIDVKDDVETLPGKQHALNAQDLTDKVRGKGLTATPNEKSGVKPQETPLERLSGLSICGAILMTCGFCIMLTEHQAKHT